MGFRLWCALNRPEYSKKKGAHSHSVRSSLGWLFSITSSHLIALMDPCKSGGAGGCRATFGAEHGRKVRRADERPCSGVGNLGTKRLLELLAVVDLTRIRTYEAGRTRRLGDRAWGTSGGGRARNLLRGVGAVETGAAILAGFGVTGAEGALLTCNASPTRAPKSPLRVTVHMRTCCASLSWYEKWRSIPMQ